MANYDKYLLLSDMDGTLIPRGEEISEVNKQAIADFVANGGYFAIATGRTPEAAAGYVKDIPINGPCVFLNGAMLYDWQAKKVLARRPLYGKNGDDSVWVQFAKACLEQLPKACIEVYTEDNCNIISDEQYDDPRLPFEYYRYRHCDLAELSDLSKTPWLKFFINADPRVLQQVPELMQEFGLEEIADHFFSAENYFEIVAKNVSKGTMLEEMRKLPGYENKMIISAGDYPNDNTMLEEADIGVATANGHEKTKAIADYIGCDVKENIIPWILENIIRE